MLSAHSLTKRFGGLLAVNDASLSVSAGEIAGLIGPNGAGKTTLFAMVAGFLSPDAGRVEFLGRDITGQPPHRFHRGSRRRLRAVSLKVQPAWA